jgi:tetratricopeptide (TPR) repeat protein
MKYFWIGCGGVMMCAAAHGVLVAQTESTDSQDKQKRIAHLESRIQSLLRGNNEERALELLDELARIQGWQTPAQDTLAAEELNRLGFYAHALRAMQARFSDLNKHTAALHIQRAIALSALRNTDQALAESDRAAELDPTLVPEVSLLKATAYIRAGRYSRALDQLKALQPDLLKGSIECAAVAWHIEQLPDFVDRWEGKPDRDRPDVKYDLAGGWVTDLADGYAQDRCLEDHIERAPARDRKDFGGVRIAAVVSFYVNGSHLPLVNTTSRPQRITLVMAQGKAPDPKNPERSATLYLLPGEHRDVVVTPKDVQYEVLRQSE